MVDDIDGNMNGVSAWVVESEHQDVVARRAKLADEFFASGGDLHPRPLGAEFDESISQGKVDVEGTITGGCVVAGERTHEGDGVVADDDVTEARFVNYGEIGTNGHDCTGMTAARRCRNGNGLPPLGEIDDRTDERGLLLGLTFQPTLTRS